MEKSYAEMVEDAKAQVKLVNVDEVMEDSSENLVLLDCREANEWHLAHIPGAVLIPRAEIEARVEETIPRDRKVVIYCATGNRSALAASVMQGMGYTDVASMTGGIRAWADAGGPIE
jgi:rhodanese-related sulfurtransferase